MKILLILVALATLSGCAFTGEGGPLNKLAVAGAKDAHVAYQLAEKADDQSAMRCWATVERVATERGGEVSIAVIGPLSTWQKARNVRLAVDDGIDEQIRADCAILAWDAFKTGRRLAGRLVPLL